MRTDAYWYVGNIEIRFNAKRNKLRLIRKGVQQQSEQDFELSFLELLTMLASFWFALIRGEARFGGNPPEHADQLNSRLNDFQKSIDMAQSFVSRYVTASPDRVVLTPASANFGPTTNLRFSSFDLRFLLPLEALEEMQTHALKKVPFSSRCLFRSSADLLELDLLEIYWLTMMAATEIFSSMGALVDEVEQEGKRPYALFHYLNLLLGRTFKITILPIFAAYRSIRYGYKLMYFTKKRKPQLNSDEEFQLRFAQEIAAASNKELGALLQRLERASADQTRRDLELKEASRLLDVRESSLASQLQEHKSQLEAALSSRREELEALSRRLAAERQVLQTQAAELQTNSKTLCEERLAFEKELAELEEIPALRQTIIELKAQNESLVHALANKIIG